MELYINSTSIQNMIQIMAPLVSFYALNNHTFEINYQASSIFYTLDLQKIWFDTVDFTGDKVFEMEPGSNIVHAKFTGINANSLLWGGVKLLHFIPMDASGVNITGLSVDVTLQPIIKDDKVHWTLKDSTAFHFDKMAIKMKNNFLQMLVNSCQGLITKMVNAELPNLGKVIDKQVQRLNAALLAEETTPFAFDVPLFGDASINLTMTTAPDLSTQNLIKVNFNGLILNKEKVYQNLDGIAYPPRIEHYLSE